MGLPKSQDRLAPAYALGRLLAGLRAAAQKPLHRGEMRSICVCAG